MDVLKGREVRLRGLSRVAASMRSSRIRTKFWLAVIPLVVGVLIVTGYASHLVSKYFLDIALSRIARVQTVALAHELEQFLEGCRQDLQLLAGSELRPEAMRNAFATIRNVRRIPYCELGFLTENGPGPIFFLAGTGDPVALAPETEAEIDPNPVQLFDALRGHVPGDTWLSPVVDLKLPLSAHAIQGLSLPAKVIRLATPVDRDGVRGVLYLSFAATALRDLLSLYNSPQSPIYAYPRTPELRYSFLFDKEGWILFQSEDPEKPVAEFRTYLARAGFTGTFGKPGLPTAFRPAVEHSQYWRMVQDVTSGHQDVMSETADEVKPDTETKRYYLAYAPIRFAAQADGPAEVCAGIAVVDRSRLTMTAGYRQVDVLFVITLGTIVLVAVCIYFVCRVITTPIMRLSQQVNEIRETGNIVEIELKAADYETATLKDAINSMIDTLKRQMAEIRDKDQRIEDKKSKERVDLEDILAGLAAATGGLIPELTGASPAVQALKYEVLRAAQAEADVLILGETGTGKQLVAEAIHSHSRRANRPFISINCGALDENLLLDTLFGHVKGAFTEAVTDRKGAFLEADGGILFLDEIQAASPKVQQALLRAIAMRRYRPLGSDREVAVDVRLVAASNVELSELAEQGRFREDLYFRLKVITLHTPALREHPEDIPLLAALFLQEATRIAAKPGLGLSRGALAGLRSHAWPGNVRELKNCITRAVVMATSEVILAADLRLSRREDAPPAELARAEAPPAMVSGRPVASAEALAKSAPELSARQKIVLPQLLERGVITRSGYQAAVGGNLPSRTAIYDLQDLVHKGLIRKVGSGANTRYVPTEALKEALGG